jgi:hypothetical protein
MKLDRELQLIILRKAADAFPDADRKFLTTSYSEEEDTKNVANALYLEEHGLLDAGLKRGLNGHFSSHGMKITARGLDFLADDGGLSAVLGVVTIKFHEDTLLSLIGDRIEQSDLPPVEKKKWTDALRSLPAETIKHLTMKLLDKGLENLPAAIPLIGTYLQSYLK